MSHFLGSRKGSIVFDLTLILIFVLTFAIASLAAYRIWDDWQVQTNDSLLYGTADDNIIEGTINPKTTTTLQSMDYIFVFVFIGLVLSVLVSAYFINSHPVFFIVSVIFLVVIIMVAAQLSNVYEDFSGKEAFVNQSSSFPAIDWTMTRLPLIIAIVGIITSIVLYTKLREGVV